MKDGHRVRILIYLRRDYLKAPLTFPESHISALNDWLMLVFQGNKYLLRGGQVNTWRHWPSRGLAVHCERGRESSGLVVAFVQPFIQPVLSSAVWDTGGHWGAQRINSHCIDIVQNHWPFVSQLFFCIKIFYKQRKVSFLELYPKAPLLAFEGDLGHLRQPQGSEFWNPVQ